MQGKGAQELRDALRITPHPVYALNVGAADVIDIVEEDASGGVELQIEQARPPTSHDMVGEVRHSEAMPTSR